MGAMIDEGHMNRVLGFIEAGQREGARLVRGGRRILENTGGYFIEPTIFDNVANAMTIAREEIFGPVLSVITVADAQEAVRVANDTAYGLASSLYTDDLNKAHTVSRALRAGTVSVNCFSEGDMGVPFGGYKQSGFGGRDKSLMAHDQYTETKTVWIQLRR
jgi:gamma-glutamyl-gamma-aminobutyraldehyde dehydrogenase